MNRNAAKLTVTGELLNAMVGLKEGIVIRAVGTDVERNTFDLLLEGAELPEVVEGGMPVQIDPTLVMQNAPASSIHVDETEMAEFIVAKMTELGATVDIEAIKTVFDLEYEYMKSIGLVNGEK